MKRNILCCLAALLAFSFSYGQSVVTAANHFIQVLDSGQRLRTLYPFDTGERYNFHFIPKEDRKGIPFSTFTPSQREAALALIRTSLSEEGVKKVQSIMLLDNVLKELEHRKPDDHYRDPNKYFITIFGIPSNSTVWGWRLEGHHISFTFTARNGKLVSGTPGFLGANPAIVLQGPQKDEEVLKDETQMAFALLQSFNRSQLASVVIDTAAPADILTFANRKAMIEHPSGLRYEEMNAHQKELMLQLVKVYVNRYTRLFADQLLKEIQGAGLNDLRFAWAGQQQTGPGHPNYYRIQGPTVIIEYDNTQNNGNHIHSVLRDLKNDFGGDELLEHYRKEH